MSSSKWDVPTDSSIGQHLVDTEGVGIDVIVLRTEAKQQERHIPFPPSILSLKFLEMGLYPRRRSAYAPLAGVRTW